MIHIPKKPTRAQQATLFEQLGPPYTLESIHTSNDGALCVKFECQETIVIAKDGGILGEKPELVWCVTCMAPRYMTGCWQAGHRIRALLPEDKAEGVVRS